MSVPYVSFKPFLCDGNVISLGDYQNLAKDPLRNCSLNGLNTGYWNRQEIPYYMMLVTYVQWFKVCGTCHGTS